MTEVAVYWAAGVQAHRAACLLNEHGIRCRTLCEGSKFYRAAASMWRKPSCRVVVAVEQVDRARQVLAPLQLIEAREAGRIAKSVGWRLAGMALCAIGGCIFTLANLRRFPQQRTHSAH